MDDRQRAQRFGERIRDLFGNELREPAGVVHVTSAWQAADGALHVLATGPDAPRSRTDRFVLQVSRARADAIVTTGKILRDEPALRCRPSPESLPWRDTLGKSRLPTVLVLTSGHELPLEHPVFEGETVLLTGVEAASRLSHSSFRHPPRIVGHAEPSLRAAIDHLRDELGARSISIEAGPSSAQSLYDEPRRVDELMLSLFQAPELPTRLRVGRLPALAELARLLPAASQPREVEEESGVWSFRRLWCPAQ